MNATKRQIELYLNLGVPARSADGGSRKFGTSAGV
jgi:hypothetical protein